MLFCQSFVGTFLEISDDFFIRNSVGKYHVFCSDMIFLCFDVIKKQRTKNQKLDVSHKHKHIGVLHVKDSGFLEKLKIENDSTLIQGS